MDARTSGLSLHPLWAGESGHGSEAERRAAGGGRAEEGRVDRRGEGGMKK